MSVNSIIVFVSPVAIFCAAGIAWFANYPCSTESTAISGLSEA